MVWWIMIKKIKGATTKQTIDYIINIVNNLNEMEMLLKRFKL